MSDRSCVAFLRWALPRMGMRWKGFRKVRRQVCRRIVRRLEELALPDLSSYRAYLGTHPGEWEHLRVLCRVTISRFHRDRGLWYALQEAVLPALATALEPGEPLRAWSAGCASGEEAYTLSLLWRIELRPRLPGQALEIVATDVDEEVLGRARAGVYPEGSLREVPSHWPRQGFTAHGVDPTEFRIRPRFREGMTILRQDLIREAPPGPFHLILCRNLAFTYFDPSLQARVLERIMERLAPGGALALGAHEALPSQGAPWPLVPWVPGEAIHRHQTSCG